PGPALRSDHARRFGVLVRVRARARPAPPHGPLLPPTESPVAGEAVARSEGWPPRILPPHARLSAPSDTRGRSAAAHHGWSPGLRAGALETPRESRHADPPQSAAGTQGLAALARGDLPRPRDVPQRLAAHAAAALPGPPSPRDDCLRAAHQCPDGASFPDRGLAQFRQALERAQAGTGHSGHEAQADGNALELVASPGHEALSRPRARPGYLDAALPQGVDHAGPAHQHPPQPQPRVLDTPPRANFTRPAPTWPARPPPSPPRAGSTNNLRTTMDYLTLTRNLTVKLGAGDPPQANTPVVAILIAVTFPSKPFPSGEGV